MNHRSRDGLVGVAAMAGCAFLWSTAGFLIKLVPWNPFAIAGCRSLVAGVFLLIWIGKPRLTFSLPQVAAAVASASTMLLFVYANKATTSANAILLQYGAPIYTAFLGAFLLNEKSRTEHWIALACIAFGMFLFFRDELTEGSLAGNIAAIASGVTFALYIVFMRMQKDGSPLESGLLAHVFTAAVAGIIALFFPKPELSLASVGAVLVLGIFQIGLATVLLSIGIRRITAIQGILVAIIEPVFSPLWVFLATAELPGTNSVMGGMVILFAVSLSSIISIRRSLAAPRGAGRTST